MNFYNPNQKLIYFYNYCLLDIFSYHFVVIVIVLWPVSHWFCFQVHPKEGIHHLNDVVKFRSIAAPQIHYVNDYKHIFSFEYFKWIFNILGGMKKSNTKVRLLLIVVPIVVIVATVICLRCCNIIGNTFCRS